VKPRLVLVSLISWLLLSACAGNPYDVGELQPYINPAFGFRVDYPSNWITSVDPSSLVGAQADKMHAVAFVSQAVRAMLVVYVQELDGDETLAGFAERQMAGLRSTAGDAAFSEPAPMLLGGGGAMMTQATVEQDGQTFLQRTLFAIRDGRGYAVSMIAPADSELASTLEEMLESFGFVQ
jgi:hypothetical protein